MSHTDALIIAVGGGKGGVGKSVVSTNVSLALSQLGMRVVLVDADLGAANLHTMLGLDQPRRTLHALLDREVESLEEVVVPTGFPRLSLVPGTVARPNAANIAYAQKQKLARHIRRLEAEVVLIDVGAGVSHNVVDLFDLADLRVVVTAAQLTALQNAYSFMKASILRELRHEARSVRERELLHQAIDPAETGKLQALLRAVTERDAAFGARLRALVQYAGAHLVGNQLEHVKEVNTVHALARMFRDFLELEAPVSAALCRNPSIHRSVSQRRPYLAKAGKEREAAELRRLAETLLEVDVRALRAGRTTPLSVEEGVPRPDSELTTPVSELTTPAAPTDAETAANAPEPLPPEPRSSPPFSARRSVSLPGTEPPGHVFGPSDSEEAPHGELGAAALPNPIRRYMRQHDRYLVNWTALIRQGFDVSPAHVHDVSMGGARLRYSRPLQRMDQVIIVFEGCHGRPELNAKVKHHNPLTGELGVEFVGDAARARAQVLVQQAAAEGAGVSLPDPVELTGRLDDVVADS